MDERGQFTFYKSYWDAIEELPAKSQLPILKAIIRYALFGEEPVSLSSVCRAVFLLVKPTLDSSRKKAANGKQGGRGNKATESKPKANQKQSASEKEKENEIEKEIEIEGENNNKSKPEAPAPFDGKAFTAFWDAYPSKIDRNAAWDAWCAIRPDSATAARIVSALNAYKASGQWIEDGGRFVPQAAKFLSKGYWKSPPAAPAVATGERPRDPDEQEAIRRLMEEPV